jgi:stage V sporulation protein D (sporulation-specific penicillin-binding protein)
VNSEGSLIEKVADEAVKQTVTKTTSDFINQGLRSVVTDGTGAKAAIDGYEVGGKTGTAEKLPRGNDEYVLSFIGSVPYDNPKVVCYVVIDTPEENPDDSGYAAQLFHNIMEEVLPYMNVFQSDTKDDNTSDATETYEDGVDIPDVGLTDTEGGYTQTDSE